MFQGFDLILLLADPKIEILKNLLRQSTIYFWSSVEVHLLKDDHKNHRVEIALPGTELESFDSAMLDLCSW